MECIQRDDKIISWLFYSVDVVEYKMIKVDRDGKCVDVSSHRIRELGADEIRLLPNEIKDLLIEKAETIIRYASEQRYRR